MASACAFRADWKHDETCAFCKMITNKTSNIPEKLHKWVSMGKISLVEHLITSDRIITDISAAEEDMQTQFERMLTPAGTSILKRYIPATSFRWDETDQFSYESNLMNVRYGIAYKCLLAHNYAWADVLIPKDADMTQEFSQVAMSMD